MSVVLSILTASFFGCQRGNMKIINGDYSIGQQKKPRVPGDGGWCVLMSRMAVIV